MEDHASSALIWNYKVSDEEAEEWLVHEMILFLDEGGAQRSSGE